MRSRTWFLLSAMLLIASFLFWQMGNERMAGRASGSPPAAASAGGHSATNTPSGQPGKTNFSLLLTQPGTAIGVHRSTGTQPPTALVTGSTPAGAASLRVNAAAIAETARVAAARHPLRLRNTDLTAGQLARQETGLLLANAFLDTALDTSLPLPLHLRSEGDPGSYIVQARGPITEIFRQELRAAEVRVVSYIPNNAYLVEAEPAAAQSLRASASVQAVLAYEPYYKLDSRLLPLAVAIPPATTAGERQRLALTLFEGREAETSAALAGLGAETLATARSPFGPQHFVEIQAELLANVARLPGVQLVEPVVARALMNDLTRVRVAVSTDTTTTNNYLGLTGDGVLVNVNDTGVDEGHPDLTGRVSTDDTNSFTLIDYHGHGTHVAGTIAGDGTMSKSVVITNAPGSTTTANVPGSIAGADFRGKAPKARVYVLPVELNAGPLISDAYVQERAAQAKAFISNNSWGYPGNNSYGSSSASFDAATRDALPEVSGSQPLLFVFSAGNDGQGNDDGLGGPPGSIVSPATAKNVIAVGATELPRLITNHYVTNIVTIQGDLSVTNEVTNYFFLAETDSEDQVGSYSSRGNVDIGTEGDFGRFKPDVVAPGSFVISARSRVWTDPTNFSTWEVIKSLNDPLAPHYRYEGGTSMSAPAVSGVLALMQEFFESRMKLTNSPALMKALIINGARSLHPRYSVQTRSLVNYQGWGGVSISNSLPAGLTNNAAASGSRAALRFIDQTPSNHLATGESRTWKFSLSPEAQQEGLRLTLVWTDPPGNPAAGLKLVNDLDLVLTNADSGLIYYGNDIPADADYNTAHQSGPDTALVSDTINNVENIFIRGPLSSNYTVTVLARRVNVNAVTVNTNGLVQDFALVVSGSNPEITNAVSTLEIEQASTLQAIPIVPVTNGVALLRQRVGGNFPLTNSTAGEARQWNFYVFTNTYFPENSLITNGTNVAFITFLPPNLGKPRRIDADIDLFVSTNSALTNLDAGVLAGATRSTSRGGNQTIYFTNAPLDTVFYVGVKSEDQQGAEFALAGISSNQPFDDTDEEGNIHIRGVPVFAAIPDGTPEQPGSMFVFGIATRPGIIGSVSVTNWITHENIGDLQGNLAHNNHFVVLNNHFSGDGGTNYVLAYDDSQSQPYFDIHGQYIRPSDGPGSLSDFIGEEATGSWILTMVDSALNHTGRVNTMEIVIRPNNLTELGLAGSLGANEIAFYYVDVPVDATNLVVAVTQMTGPLNVYIRRGALPNFTDYDKAAFMTPPGGLLTLTPRDVPPLVGGRYFVAVFNPGAITVTYRISVRVERGLAIDADQVFTLTELPKIIPDDALSRSAIDVPIDREIVDVQVGVRINHPRVADLVLRLRTPQGNPLLLAENRGGLSGTGFGSGSATNVSYVVFSESETKSQEFIKFAPAPFAGSGVVTQMFLGGFEGIEAREYRLAEIFDGWTVLSVGSFSNKTTGVVTTNHPAVAASSLAHTGTQFLSLGGAVVAREIPTVPGKTYYVSFRYWSETNSEVRAYVTLNGVSDALITARPSAWAVYTKLFTATQTATRLELASDRATPGLLFDTFTLADSGAVYFRPEESLKELAGENAQGRWQLEVVDNRAGDDATVTPEILSWQLQFILAPPKVPTVLLQNGVVHTDIVVGDEIKYFVVETPRSASFATNLVFSPGDVVLLYSGSGLPNGRYPGDVLVDQVGTNSVEFLILDTNRPPVLVPGQRYYLGVGNYNRRETNSFSIRVDFDKTDDPYLNLTRLISGVPYTNTIQVTNALDYYRFDVSGLATNVTFEVFPENGNVDLVVRKALPVPNSLPRVGQFDYQSTNAGVNAESIIVDDASWPVPLSPGPWYLGVYNRDQTPVTYRIVATEILPPITKLTNGIPLVGRVLSSNTFEHFSFTVSPSATEASFKLLSLSGNVDLLLRRGPPVPNLTNFHYISTNLFTNDEVITLTTNSLPQPLAPGDWYLTVTNGEPNAVTYTIIAEEIVPFTGVQILSVVLTNGSICVTWASVPGAAYQVQAKSRVDEAAWTTVSFNVLASAATTTHCLPASATNQYFQVIQVSGGPPASSPVISASSLVIVSNQLCLTWSSEVGARYHVEGKADVGAAAWVSLSGSITATAPQTQFCLPLTNALQFLRIVVDSAPPGGTTTNVPPVTISSITAAAGRVTLRWTSQPNASFQVEFAPAVVGPWLPAGPATTSTTSDYQFIDDGSTTGGLGVARFYRIRG